MSAVPLFDGCQVVERLESGAMTDLYRGLQQPLGRPVFIKALSTSILPSSPFAAALEREARVLASLQHPNVLRLYDFGRDAERMWLVLEHVDGWTLAEILEQEAQLAPRAAAAIALEVALALAHAHSRGVVHRDVRPSNLRITTTGQVKLSNFSMSDGERLVDAPELLAGGSAFHRPAYMSPEQILGESSDARSDIFSLGVVLYEMLAGRAPFEGADVERTSQRIRHLHPIPLSRYAPKTGSALERITLRCLQKLPSDRFSSAVELALALEGAITELGGGATSELIQQELARAGLSQPPPPLPGTERPPMLARRAELSLGQAALGLGFFSALILAGGAFVRPALPVSGQTPESSPVQLPLVPEKMAYLRVVAEPWAHVFVDGQKVDTTPFARSLPLSAGTHFVRLEHPDAPIERRTVNLVPDETLLLDVVMKVPALPPSPATADSAGDGGIIDNSP